MFTFIGYGQVESIQMGEGTGLGIKTYGKYPQVLPMYFPKRISRPKLKVNVFLRGEIVMSKKGFILLRVDYWQTLRADERAVYVRDADAAPDAPPAADGMM